MGLISESDGGFSKVRRYEVTPGQNQIQPERIGNVSSSLKYHRVASNSCTGFSIWLWISHFLCYLKRVFLPYGYPQSVAEEYFEYQLWDTLQEFSHSICMTWVTIATLQVVGVGNEYATALGSTVTVLLADGAAKLARIACLQIKGDIFRQNHKKWRLVADALMDTVVLIEIMTPCLPKSSIVFVFCLLGVLKVGVDVAGKITRTTVFHHLAGQDNVTEVQDKEWIQNTVTKLIALIVSIFLTRILNNDTCTSLTVYGIHVIFHLYGNYRLVRTLQMKEFNEERLLICIRQFLIDGTVPTIRKVNELESVVIGFGTSAVDICGYSIQLGVPVQKTLLALEKTTDMPGLDFYGLLSGLRNNPYLIVLNSKSKIVSVILRAEVTRIEITQAYFLAVLTALYEGNKGNVRKSDSNRMEFQISEDWVKFLDATTAMGFQPEKSNLLSSEFRVQWKSD